MPPPRASSLANLVYEVPTLTRLQESCNARACMAASTPGNWGLDRVPRLVPPFLVESRENSSSCTVVERSSRLHLNGITFALHDQKTVPGQGCCHDAV